MPPKVMAHLRRTRILLQPARQRTVPEAPWEYGFAQFLGRKLTPAEIAVIRPIEKARKKWQARPFLVIDPPGADSTALLRKYQEYCLSLCEETYGILVHPAGERPRNRNRQIFLTSPRNTEATRGMTSRFTLLLHVERYRTVSPFSGSSYNYRWRDLWCTLVPPARRRRSPHRPHHHARRTLRAPVAPPPRQNLLHFPSRRLLKSP